MLIQVESIFYSIMFIFRSLPNMEGFFGFWLTCVLYHAKH